MPRSPKRPCRYPGCPNLCKSGTYCPEHSAASPDRLRGNAAERGYDAKWRRARKRFLQRHPLCADHIVPHRGDRALFWDEKNWQPLCKSCHDRKTGSGR